MINAQTIKAVQQLLQGRGIEQNQQERLGDYLARGLGISAAQAEKFLEALYEGRSIEEAQAIAEIPEDLGTQKLLIDIARAIGTGLGKISKLTNP